MIAACEPRTGPRADGSIESKTRHDNTSCRGRLEVVILSGYERLGAADQ
jgi:hypothetical protein